VWHWKDVVIRTSVQQQLLSACAFLLIGCRNTNVETSFKEEQKLIIRSYTDPGAVTSLLKAGDLFTRGKGRLHELTLLRIAELHGSPASRLAIALEPNAPDVQSSFYQSALKFNTNSLEALYGLVLSSSQEKNIWLQRWSESDATNSLPYYLSAFLILETSPSNALKRIEVGNRTGASTHRPLFLRIESLLSKEAHNEAVAAWRTNPRHPSAHLIRILQVLQEVPLNRAQLVHLLIFANNIATSVPHTIIDGMLGLNLGLTLLKSPSASKVLAPDEVRRSILQREVTLAELRKLDASDIPPASLLALIATDTSALLKEATNQ
jgi:hypothetical protein